ncbi:MAG: ATP-binding cassette domain-containing protein, partial [Chloroflexota bacterium]
GLLDAPTGINDPATPKSINRDKHQIQLQEVDFAYQKGQHILSQVNINIKAGQSIGIAGPTGSGKTTFIKLLMRFYDVSAGAILIEGVDIRELSIRELRRQIALVSQEVYLFHGTISENIAYGLEDCTQEEIENAAKKAELHSFIAKLPLAYQSIVGERGIKLSGGQRQRLSIARAILKDAPILILDEATSAVDTETERAIQKNLQKLTQGKTAIIIAHRLSTIRHADNIIVLKDGQLVEQGTHDNLLKLEGTYSELWHVQTGELENSN